MIIYREKQSFLDRLYYDRIILCENGRFNDISITNCNKVEIFCKKS